MPPHTHTPTSWKPETGSIYLLIWEIRFTDCYCSVTQSYLTLCDPMNCSTPVASLSFTVSRSLLKLMSIESMMSSKHLVLCHPFLLLPSIFPSVRVFSSESALHKSIGTLGQSIGASASASFLPVNLQVSFSL